MNIEKITYKGSGNIELPGLIWLPSECETDTAVRPKAILQITHGMTEHIVRTRCVGRIFRLVCSGSCLAR